MGVSTRKGCTGAAVIMATMFVAMISLVGCSRPEIIRDDGVTLMVGTAENRADAMLVGTLGITEAGCMGMTLEGSTDVVPAVWPPGTRLVLDGQAIEYDDQIFEIGESLSGGGGVEPSAGLDPPDECQSSNYAVLWKIS